MEIQIMRKSFATLAESIPAAIQASVGQFFKKIGKKLKRYSEYNFFKLGYFVIFDWISTAIL